MFPRRIKTNDYSNPAYRNFPFDAACRNYKINLFRHTIRPEGCKMKKWMFILLAVSFLMPVAALAQHSSKAAEGAPIGAPTAKVPQKAVTILGQVSMDGKSLVSEENDIWNVSNPDMLSGQKGKRVSVKCQVHTDINEIHVLSVKGALQEVKFVSNKSDSAFRR
jgi:hypothetical protein